MSDGLGEDIGGLWLVAGCCLILSALWLQVAGRRSQAASQVAGCFAGAADRKAVSYFMQAPPFAAAEGTGGRRIMTRRPLHPASRFLHVQVAVTEYSAGQPSPAQLRARPGQASFE